MPAARLTCLLAALSIVTSACLTSVAPPTARPVPSVRAAPTTAPSIALPPAFTVAPAGTPSGAFVPTGSTAEARVISVTDGDTVRVLIGGMEYPLRYIGIDAPESHHPSAPVEWLAGEATAANAELVAGRTVVLEMDVSETDRFDRLLRHVWLAEASGWVLVSLELVRRGYAQAVTYPPDVKYTDRLRDAEAEAREAGLGLWGEPPSRGQPPGDGPPGDGPPGDDPPGDGPPGEDDTPLGLVDFCDTSYPDACIPPAPPDLDCGDVPERRFTVVPPDPHGFDGDHDGIGCEGS